MMLIDGQVQLRSCNHELCGGVLEHRTLQGSVNLHCLLFGLVKSIWTRFTNVVQLYNTAVYYLK